MEETAMSDRSITALFDRETDARRAADAVTALGYGAGRSMLVPCAELAGGGGGGAGFVLVVSPDPEDEDKLVGVIDHYRPERLDCREAAVPPSGPALARVQDGRPEGAGKDRTKALPLSSAAARLRAAAAALQRVHDGMPAAPGATGERPAAEKHRSLRETKARD